MKPLFNLLAISFLVSFLVSGANYDITQYGDNLEKLPSDKTTIMKIALTEAQKDNPDSNKMIRLRSELKDISSKDMDSAVKELFSIKDLKKLKPSDLPIELHKLDNVNSNLLAHSELTFSKASTRGYVRELQGKLSKMNYNQNKAIALRGAQGMSRGKAVGYGALGAAVIGGLGAATYFAYENYYRRRPVILPPPPFLPPVRSVLPPRPLPPLPPMRPIVPPPQDIIVGVPTPYYVKKNQQ